MTSSSETATCAHLDLGPDAVSVIAPIRGHFEVYCPCCKLPGQVKFGDAIAGMLCPYCDVQAEVTDDRR